MRGVTQDTTGWPFGSCVRASYATLLNLPIEQVPPLDPGTAAEYGQQQGDLERAWLASLGFGLFEISVVPPAELSNEILGCIPEVPHLISGISPRGYGHRCIGIGGKVAWDPHPSRAGLVSVYAVGLLVPLDTVGY